MNNNLKPDFDVRLSYLTENDIKHWNTLNHFTRTLWFDNEICGPDIEYSRLSVEIFKIYPHYSTWSHVPRQNGGYLLENKSLNPPLTINGDLMNGWWNIFKRLANIDSNRHSCIPILYEHFQNVTDNNLVNELSTKFGHNPDVWKAFLNYLDVVYTIGNLSPTGANPGGNGLDLWHIKLSSIKELWFDKDFFKQEEIYNTRTSTNSIINKWAPLLWQSYKANQENSWEQFVNDHFYNGYVENDYHLSTFSLDMKDDESIISFLNQLKGIIIDRGKKIINSPNKTISFDNIPHYSIVLK